MAIQIKRGDETDTTEIEALFRELPFDRQRELVGTLQTILEEGVGERRRQLEAELAALDEVGGGAARPRATRRSSDSESPRGKVAAKYRSRRDASQVWSGRGVHPRWLREEMEETGDPKESFLISASDAEE